MKSLACLVLFLFGFLLTGCGYERYPVRVRWHLQTAPPTDIPAEKFLTYGLDVTPPWPDPGTILLSIPETISADSGATTLFSSHDLAFTISCPKCVQATLFTGPPAGKTVHCSICGTPLPVLPSVVRRDVWDIANNERTARLDLDSPSTPGVHLRIDLKVEGPRMDFNLSLTNNTKQDLHKVFASFRHDMTQLNGFSESVRRGPFVPRDRPIVVLTENTGTRKFLITWQPGEVAFIESNYSSLFVNSRLGDLPAGKSVHATGLILFSEGPTEKLLQEALKPAR